MADEKPKKPYVHQDFPTCMYRRDETAAEPGLEKGIASTIVASKEELDALPAKEGWVDSPAKVEAPAEKPSPADASAAKGKK